MLARSCGEHSGFLRDVETGFTLRRNVRPARGGHDAGFPNRNLGLLAVEAVAGAGSGAVMRGARGFVWGVEVVFAHGACASG